MTQAEFIKRNQSTIDALRNQGKEVIVSVQTVGGTAYQKTSHRILKCVSEGHRNIVVLTNSNNPVISELDSLCQASNLAMPSAQVKLHSI